MTTRTSALIILIILVATSALAQPSDVQIRDTIQNRIKTIPVTVAVDAGIVTLTGTVPTFEQKRQALDLAARTVGVKSITDRIKVQPAQQRTDRQIMDDVRNRLKTNLGDSAGKIHVEVAGGVVTLTGTLPSSYPKQVAGFLAGLSPGVVDVRNDITVKPTLARTDAEIAQDIRSRFRRNTLIQDQDIEVAVNSGIVTLTGTVGTFRQVDQAEAIARFTPGVVGVNNQLFVRS